MEPSYQQPLVAAIDSLELDGRRGDGAIAAIQARLARRRLPTIGRDGLVQYVELDGGLGADTAWVELGGSVLMTGRDPASTAGATPSTPGSAARQSPTPPRWPPSSTSEKLNKTTGEHPAREVNEPSFFPSVLRYAMVLLSAWFCHCQVGLVILQEILHVCSVLQLFALN